MRHYCPNPSAMSFTQQIRHLPQSSTRNTYTNQENQGNLNCYIFITLSGLTASEEFTKKVKFVMTRIKKTSYCS